MSKEIQVQLMIPNDVCGSQAYTVTLRVTNVSRNDISALVASPIVLAGFLIDVRPALDQSEVDELKNIRKNLIKEIEGQIEAIYARQKFKALTPIERFISLFIEASDFYASAFMRTKYSIGIPSWAQQTLRIHDITDVGRLEKEFMQSEPDDSPIKKVFLISKEKLYECQKKINAKTDMDANKFVDDGDKLPPGASISYPFKIKAPHRLRASDELLEFSVKYKTSEGELLGCITVSERINLRASEFAVPTASIFGALCGYLIKVGLVSTSSFAYSELASSCILGLVFSLMVSRRQGLGKSISVEDAVGGFIVGALAGTFSAQILARIELLVK